MRFLQKYNINKQSNNFALIYSCFNYFSFNGSFLRKEKVEKRQVIVLEELRKEENKRIQIWADAVSQMASINIGETLDPCVLDILKSNNTIPAIWLGANGELKAHRNLNTKEIQLKKLIKGQEKKLLDSSKIKLLNDSLKIIQDSFEKI